MAEKPSGYIGIDVGTGSVRAALVNDRGQVLFCHVVPLKVCRVLCHFAFEECLFSFCQIHNPEPDHYYQSSANVWSSLCEAVRAVVHLDAGAHVVKGVGVDATCSLVIYSFNNSLK